MADFEEDTVQGNDVGLDQDIEALETEAWLVGLLDTSGTRMSEYRVRNSAVNYLSVHSADEEEKIERGWQLVRKGKRQSRLKQSKPLSQMLEDRAWCLLYRMGYTDQNSRQFKIKFRRSSGSIGSKQIDAFGWDSETCVIVECKSKQERGRKSLAKDISETAALQNYIRSSIHEHYKDKPKAKLIWLYVTENIIWSESDVNRAQDAGIYIVTENELQYFETFLKHMGPAGRYQILGEFLKGQKIPALEGLKIPAIRGSIGGNKFFSFVTTPRVLLKIAFVNHQALNHPDGRPAYQRMVNSKRIKDIGEYISKKGGFFPTNILINFTKTPSFDLLPNKENTDPNIKFGWLTVPPVYRSAWIIDGQHRLYGYSGLNDAFLDQSLFVLAFDNMDTYREADLFITINHKQKSVPKGLLDLLLADLKMGDPDPKQALAALASAVVRQLNNDKTGPLGRRFALPDVQPAPGQNLTVSEAVNGITRSALLGKVMQKARVPGPLSAATDDDSIDRARVILNGYFEQIRLAHPARWEAGKDAYICVNPGVRAHLMLIPEIISYLSHKKGLDFAALPEDRFVVEIVSLIGPIRDFIRDASDEAVRLKFSRKFGEGGVKEYLFNLCELVQQATSDFGSDEFKLYLERRASDEIDEANGFVLKLSEKMLDCVVKVLKGKYGTHQMPSGESAYWELGVQSQRVLKNAAQKQLDDKQERRKRKEAYLDVIDLKDIVEEKDNWVIFESIFSVPMPGETKGKKYYTGWIGKFNDIRKIAAHKNALRTYNDADLEFIDWLRAEISPRIDKELAL